MGGGGFCKLLHTGTGKWSQASCLHCSEGPPLLVNISVQLPALQHVWRGLKLSVIRYTREHAGHTRVCRCSFNSSLLFMVGDGILDNSLTITNLEGIHCSVSITLSWWNEWTAPTLLNFMTVLKGSLSSWLLISLFSLVNWNHCQCFY